MNNVDYNRNNLHDAAGDGDVYKLNQLLHDGEDKNAQDESRYSPLHFAAMYDRPMAALALVKAGAKLDLRDFKEKTPLQHAIEKHGENSVIALFLKGAMARNPKDHQEIADELLRELE